MFDFLLVDEPALTLLGKFMFSVVKLWVPGWWSHAVILKSSGPADMCKIRTDSKNNGELSMNTWYVYTRVCH